MMPFKVCFAALVLCAVTAMGAGLDVAFANMNDTGLDFSGRELQQAAVKPCRWNTVFSSCDFNYAYVARINPKNAAASAAKQWFINARTCDSKAYQRSSSKCMGDNLHFCQWIPSLPGAQCSAVLQDFYNYKLACAGSLAKEHYLCSIKYSATACKANSACNWIKVGSKSVCRPKRLLSGAQRGMLTSTNLKFFRTVWGACAGSNTAFNQTICSKQKTKTACANSKYCTWGVFSTGPVCYTSDRYSNQFLYGNDPTFKFLLKRCGVSTKAACEGVTAKVASLTG